MGVQKGSCSTSCVKCIQWFPVLFLGLLIAWSYYAYVYSLSIVLVKSVSIKVVYLIFYHVILVIFLWCYLKAIWEPPCVPPREFALTEADWMALHDVNITTQDKKTIVENIVDNRRLPVRMVRRDGNIGLCEICGVIKPDRAHHCSTCKKCVLQLDHHCPWINNCVGFHNHKYFIIFLGWGTVYCLYMTVTTAPYFVEFWSNIDLTVDRFQVLFLFIVATMFGVCQAVLGGYHCYLVGRNQTTLETFAALKYRDGSSDPRAFDLGRKANFQEMFGTNCLKAIFPLKTTQGDGVHWRHRSDRRSLTMLENGLGSSSHLVTS